MWSAFAATPEAPMRTEAAAIADLLAALDDLPRVCGFWRRKRHVFWIIQRPARSG